MGLFDDIRIAAPHNEALDSRVRDATFQTKDLECLLHAYEISSEGRLLWRIAENDAVVSDVDYHGDIVFYVLLPDKTELEYKARFTDGTLQWIRQIETVS